MTVSGLIIAHPVTPRAGSIDDAVDQMRHEGAMARSRWAQRSLGTLLAVFAIVGLLLAAVGVYADPLATLRYE